MIKLIDGFALTSTTGPEELHEFAGKVGVDRKCYLKGGAQGASGCYVLQTRKLQQKARSLGAVFDTRTTHTKSSRKRDRQIYRQHLLAPRKT